MPVDACKADACKNADAFKNKVGALKNNQLQGGAGLIEVVVSLFILAVGLLGVLAMQANGVKSNQRAMFSTEAQLLAGDMVDRIFAYDNLNRGDVVNYNGNEYNGIDTSAAAPADPGCAATGCSTAQQVTYDVWDWNRQLTSRLPGGIGTVSFANNVYTLTVMWDQELTGVNGTGCSGDSGTDLACYRLEVIL